MLYRQTTDGLFFQENLDKPAPHKGRPYLTIMDFNEAKDNGVVCIV